MSPIVGITTNPESSAPEIARLRLGPPKKESANPSELPYFRFDPRPGAANANLAELFAATFGEEPKVLSVRMPFAISRCWDASYTVYNTSGRLGEADGEKWLYLRNNQTGELVVKNGVPVRATPDLPRDENGMPYLPFDPEMPVYAYFSKKKNVDIPVYAKAEGRLKIFIPALKRAGYVVMITHSIYNILNLSNELAGIEEQAKMFGYPITMVPMRLTRQLEKISVAYDGKKHMEEHYLVHVEIEPAWAEAAFSVMDKALPGAALQVLPAPKVMALPEPKASDFDESDYYEDLDDAAPAPAPAPAPTATAQTQQRQSNRPAAPAAPRALPATTTTLADVRPYAPEVVKAKVEAATAAFATKLQQGLKFDEQYRKMLSPNMKMLFAGDNAADAKRREVLEYLTGKTSTKDLSDEQVMAMRRWVRVGQDESGEWLPDGMAVKEAALIYAESLRAKGQMDMPLETEPIETEQIADEPEQPSFDFLSETKPFEYV